ncbi:OmpA family protein [Maribacter sp.]|nr:OmpA family protein [Maribacter sp.]
MAKKLLNLQLVLLTVLLSLSNIVHGQNLVKNPSFEEFTNCPEELGNIEVDVPNWSKSSEGTTDYFNVCSLRLGIPKNFNGSQAAEFGTGYAGLYLSAPNDYREYLQGELAERLVKGKRYEVSFHISLAEKSREAIRDIGVLFSEKMIKEDTRKALTRHQDKNKDNEYNFAEVRNWSYYTDKKGWMLVQTDFIANGTEKYLTIGNFRDNARSKVAKIEGDKSAAYYYLDQVSVVDYNSKYPFSDLELNRTYVLENVLFPNDVYRLNNESKKELDQLYIGLSKNKKLFVTVQAHTDDVGSKNYNRSLSSKRAQAVAKYLMAKGLQKNRIRWAGFGGDQPVAENNTSAGKQRNRRAEFVITNATFEDNTSITETIFEDAKD